MQPEPPELPNAVIIDCHPDGTVEVYARRGTTIHFRQRLLVNGAKSRILEEEYQDLRTPTRLQPLAEPVNLRGTLIMQTVAPSDVLIAQLADVAMKTIEAVLPTKAIVILKTNDAVPPTQSEKASEDNGIPADSHPSPVAEPRLPPKSRIPIELRLQHVPGESPTVWNVATGRVHPKCDQGPTNR